MEQFTMKNEEMAKNKIGGTSQLIGSFKAACLVLCTGGGPPCQNLWKSPYPPAREQKSIKRKRLDLAPHSPSLSVYYYLTQ